ncbi:MAG TPA: beta-N-acetylhexosaminidase [Gemmatimonadaceae bacterium]|nr:beta-N-acetylhexosaminidase [Gemmatimonadaceae bacterium]
MRQRLAVVALVLLSAVPLAAQRPPALVPLPREITFRAPLSLRGGVAVVTAGADAEDRFAADELRAAFRERGVRVAAGAGQGGVTVTLARASHPAAQAALRRHGVTLDPAMREEGYAILPDAGRLVVVGATAAGLFYGAQTVKQLLDGTGADARLHAAQIRDWPAMRYRGFHDDLSRGPVPTLEFQKKQIRTFAAYKLNVYSPYFEHTLEYRSNPLIAPPGGAVTREQVKELVDYARRYHVEVIPEQEAFGHLHHVLKYELYSPLGETQHGHVLAPGQGGSLDLIKQMFFEIDTLFPGRFIHIGADETFELGRGQTAERVRSEGIGAVYLKFLADIEQALRPLNRRLLFWGDVAMNHPELVKTLPKDLVAVGWVYDPLDSFDKYLVPFRDAGMETWVAPGVNNWNRAYPNNLNALTNIRNFVRDGQRLGSVGMLNTSWDDDGEAIFNQTWYGVLFGAAAAWQPGESSIDAFQASYGRAFHGDTTGNVDEAQRKLIEWHALLRRARIGDATNYLFWLDPWSAEGLLMGDRIRPARDSLRLLAEQAIVLLARARSAQPASLRETDALDAIELGARRLDLIGMKFQFADEVAQLYAHAVDTVAATGSAGRYLADITGVNGRLQDLRDAYGVLRDEYERAWMRENRPYWRHSVLARYDLATQLWISRADAVSAARTQLGRTRKLPSAAEVGIPAPR